MPIRENLTKNISIRPPLRQAGLAPHTVQAALQAPGQALDPQMRARMEPRFGHDFSRVRIHTEARAAESAREVGAPAYTVGRDIFFDRGAYVPGSSDGQRLLAHELAHVIQQQGGAATPAGSIRLGDPDSPAEAAAETAALSDGPARVQAGVAPGVLQRAPQKYDPRGGPWSATRHITAGMGYFDDAWWSTVNAEGHYDTSDGTDRPFSQVFTGQLCTGEPLPLNFAFHVDTFNTPRKQPFATGRVVITLNFLTAKGRTIPVKNLVSATQYMSPGLALLTSFGLTPDFTPPEPGQLLVSLTHSDPASGQLVTYSDQIPVSDCPWNQPIDHHERPTRFVAVIPDPVNQPSQYHLLTPQDGLDRKGLITPIEQDDLSYFYRIDGKKIYIEDPNTK